VPKLKVLRDCFVCNYLHKEGTYVEYDAEFAKQVKNFAVVEDAAPAPVVETKQEEVAFSQMVEKPVIIQPDAIDRMTYAELKAKAKELGIVFKLNPAAEWFKAEIRAKG